MIGVAIESRNLVKCYGKRRALDGFSLAIPRGCVLGLVGPNGAGKTTWMMSVARLVRYESGSIAFTGTLGLLPQDSELPLEMSARSLLIGLAGLQGMASPDAKAAADSVLAKVNLLDRADASVRSLSHGMRKRVMTAQCFLGDPDLVLLDEPMNGLDPEEVVRFRNLILSRRESCTVIVSSHNLANLEKFCTHIAFIRDGKVTKVAPLKDLTADGASLENAYLVQLQP